MNKEKENIKKSISKFLKEEWENRKWVLYAGFLYFLCISLYYFIKSL